MVDLKDLIERLEKADATRQQSVILDVIEFACQNGWITQNVRHRAMDWVVRGAYESAALTLMPEKFQAYVATGVGRGYAHACVWTDHPCRISGGAREVATPAIALCIAALKARDAMKAA